MKMQKRSYIQAIMVIISLMNIVCSKGMVEAYIKDKNLWNPNIEPWTTWKLGPIWNILYINDDSSKPDLIATKIT